MGTDRLSRYMTLSYTERDSCVKRSWHRQEKAGKGKKKVAKDILQELQFYSDLQTWLISPNNQRCRRDIQDQTLKVWLNYNRSASSP